MLSVSKPYKIGLLAKWNQDAKHNMLFLHISGIQIHKLLVCLPLSCLRLSSTILYKNKQQHNPKEPFWFILKACFWQWSFELLLCSVWVEHYSALGFSIAGSGWHIFWHKKLFSVKVCIIFNFKEILKLSIFVPCFSRIHRHVLSSWYFPKARHLTCTLAKAPSVFVLICEKRDFYFF